jgi:hypothetical protein
LASDVPEKFLVFRIVLKAVIIAAPHWFGDVLILSIFGQNGNKFCAIGVVVIDLLIGKQAFPFDSLACSFFGLALHLGQVVLGADDQDVICGVDLLFHPARPIGGRIPKLIEGHVDSIVGQTVGQF